MQLVPEQVASRGTAGPRALAVLRAAWRCDCDGVSHEAGGHVPAGPAADVERHRQTIEQVTGHRPVSCPWRAFQDALVDDAMLHVIAADKGYIMAKLGEDPPAALLDALDLFFVARGASDRFVRKHRERKSAPKSSGSSGGKGVVSMRRRGRRG